MVHYCTIVPLHSLRRVSDQHLNTGAGAKNHVRKSTNDNDDQQIVVLAQSSGCGPAECPRQLFLLTSNNGQKMKTDGEHDNHTLMNSELMLASKNESLASGTPSLHLSIHNRTWLHALVYDKN